MRSRISRLRIHRSVGLVLLIVTVMAVALAAILTVGSPQTGNQAWAHSATDDASLQNYPGPGEEQVAAKITLVSNLEQVTAPEGWERVGPDEDVVYLQVQGFTTGNSETGYTLSKVVAYLKDVGSNDAPKVSIYTSDANGNPNDILYTLTNPASFADDARNTFSAPANANLAAGTDYFVAFENDVFVTSTEYYQVGFVAGNGQDAGAAAGWTLATDQYYSVLVGIQGSIPTASDTTRSANPTRSNSSLNEAAKTHIEDEFVKEYEDDHPWVRTAWSDHPLQVRVGDYKNPGFYVYSIGGVQGFRGVNRGLRLGFTVGGYHSRVVVLHELAHHFTLDPRVPDAPEAVGVGWLYFNHRVKGDCPVSEIYPDVLGYYTHRVATTSVGYLGNCREIARNGKPDAESVSVAGSVARGEIPAWFQDHYGRDDETMDLDAIWADLRVASSKRTAAYLMRNMFGGFCSLREANWAIGSSGPSHGNPWQDGGCHWRKPQDAGLTIGNGSLKISWDAHLYETSPAVTHYIVQWRTAGQSYSADQQALVSETADLTHTIEGLTDGSEYFVRIAAVNSNSTDSVVDNDGHSRSVELAAVPGKPTAPRSVSASPDDQEIQVSWREPQNHEIELTGYVVEWKSGDEAYDASRRLEVSGGSTRSATITGLINAVPYVIRVSAVAADGTVGTPSAELTAAPAGRPLSPLNVWAVGGRNSLLINWEPPQSGTPANRYIVEWRTGGTYEPANRADVRDASATSHLLKKMAGHGRYYVRVRGANPHGWSTPSDEYFVMSGAPGAPTDFDVEVRPEGGFDLTWDRPDPYYPNIPDFRPVRTSNRVPIRDVDGNKVPQFRYDVEYKLADGQPGGWCSQSRYRDMHGYNESLDPADLALTVTGFCEDAVPVVGERYNFRIRAAYVWLNSGNTNERNGPWQYSGGVSYNPSGSVPDVPTGVEAVGGKESLLVFWDPPTTGTPAVDYLVQWRTGASYESGDEAVVEDPGAGSRRLKKMAGHGRYYVRVVARNLLGESEPSDEYFVMSGAPGAPTDFDVQVRPGGGFALTWDRPDPYYPNISDFRPVRDGSRVPIRDGDGNTVPQFRYDVEYKLVDGQPGGWCSQSRYKDMHGYNESLDPADLKLTVTGFCQDAEPVVGERYNFRIRASYVWLNSGDTNVRNGPWRSSGGVSYNPSGSAPDVPTGIEAVGGKESLLVSWDSPSTGTPADEYLVQWRTGGSYRARDEVVVGDPEVGSRLLGNMAGHGRYHVRVVARNVLGESEPSDEYFVMSGAPGVPREFTAEVRPSGGFDLSWKRTNPYYPNNPDFRPVRTNNRVPILDGDGNTVPQFRYDVEFKLADGQPGGWCSQSRYRDMHGYNENLDPAPLTLVYDRYCQGAAPVDGSSYNFRIRAAYVWLNSGDTNSRNGPWQNSGPVLYNPTVYNSN